MEKQTEPWYGVKLIFHEPSRHFEERVIVVNATSFDDAEEKAIKEAIAYTEGLDNLQFIAVIDVFHMYSKALGDSAEIYSNITETKLDPDTYLQRRYEKWDGEICFKAE